jgi:WD40 repeat protein
VFVRFEEREGVGTGGDERAFRFLSSPSPVDVATSTAEMDVLEATLTPFFPFFQMRVNQLVFNPLQPPILLCASEDHNLYTFDMRNLSSTTQVYKGHVGATMSADWSPTGREFVSGSYDRTVRLWKTGEGAARDTYHTKRMQRCVCSPFLSSLLSPVFRLPAFIPPSTPPTFARHHPPLSPVPFIY